MLIYRSIYRYVCLFLRAFVLSTLLFLLVPYAVGFLAYGCTFGGVVEQLWLDKAIQHLAILKVNCPENDQELRNVLTYTMKRYHRIGPFDVSVSRCDYFFQQNVLGTNAPQIPGITLDIKVLLMPVSEGSMILVHESLHDYYPYFGHGHVDPIMSRLEALNMRVRRQ